MNVVLRPVEDRDLDAIFGHGLDPEATHMAAFTVADPADRDAFVERMSRQRAEPSIVQRVVEADGVLVGTIASFVVDGEREVTYWIAREHWGKGIASAALQILIAEVGERPLHARAASDNAASLRVLEKAGFRRIGVDHGFANGRGEQIEETILRLD